MSQALQGALSVLGRVLLCAIFFLSAAGNDIPNFKATAELMGKQGVPYPEVMLVGAIAFLLAGSVSVVLGYRARLSALLLLIFLGLASYYFHNFWDYTDPKDVQNQMTHFMKNAALAGAMVFLIANGPGRASLDARRARPPL
jgi:putative oxidoreductase